MIDDERGHDDHQETRPQQRRLEDLTPEERERRLERFIWKPGDITIIKHPRNITDPPPVLVRRPPTESGR
jgi:hypothetical protein